MPNRLYSSFETHEFFFFKAYYEELAGKEKAARLLNEPSPVLMEYLSDELISLSGNEEPLQAPTKGPNAEAENIAKLDIDQFPSLPQPAAAPNGSIFEKNIDWENSIKASGEISSN